MTMKEGTNRKKDMRPLFRPITAYWAPTFIIVAGNQCRPVVEKGQWMIIYTQQWKHNSGDMSCAWVRGRQTNKNRCSVDSWFPSGKRTRVVKPSVEVIFDCRVCVSSPAIRNVLGACSESDSFKVAFNCTLLCTWLRKLFWIYKHSRYGRSRKVISLNLWSARQRKAVHA